VVIARDPQANAAYTNRGLSYYRLGEYKKAFADYITALEIYPDPDGIAAINGSILLEELFKPNIPAGWEFTQWETDEPRTITTEGGQSTFLTLCDAPIYLAESEYFRTPAEGGWQLKRADGRETLVYSIATLTPDDAAFEFEQFETALANCPHYAGFSLNPVNISADDVDVIAYEGAGKNLFGIRVNSVYIAMIKHDGVVVTMVYGLEAPWDPKPTAERFLHHFIQSLRKVVP
jgi:hypothetical protein